MTDEGIAVSSASVGALRRVIVERARQGDEAAFEQLLRPSLGGLFSTACAILGREADARDATQEACVSAWRQLPTLRDLDRFDAWLLRILINECRMALRRRSRVREVALVDDRETATSRDGDPTRVAETELVERADARALLVLHHLNEQPVAAIAAVLGIPSGTVKWRLHAARRAFRKALEREQR
jgi:RNA polymerase sigma-70 factor, ECF subfamily